LQALVTLNDPQFVEAARNLAERTLKVGGAQDAARIDFMAARLIATIKRGRETNCRQWAERFARALQVVAERRRGVGGCGRIES